MWVLIYCLDVGKLRHSVVKQVHRTLIVTTNYRNESILHCKFFFSPVLGEWLSINKAECCVFSLIHFFVFHLHLIFMSGFYLAVFFVFRLIGRFVYTFLIFEKIPGKLFPAPLLVLGDRVCWQLIGNEEIFCDFCRTLIAASSQAAFLNLSIFCRYLLFWTEIVTFGGSIFSG